MECLNCGGAINSQIAGQVVSCEYCGTTTAWLPKIEIGSSSSLSPEIEKLLKLAQIDIDAKRYSQADDTLKRIVAIDPTCWQAYANLALVKFWLGDTSFGHLGEVKDYLAKASTFGDDANFISSISGAISFNTAQLINIQNPIGDRLINAIIALRLTRELRPDHPERDNIVNQFARNAASKILDRLDGFLKRDGKSFDPPKSELLTASGLLLLAKEPEINLVKKVLAYSNFKNAKLTISDNSLKTNLMHLVEIYRKNTGETKDPTLVFSLFKGPSIQ